MRVQNPLLVEHLNLHSPRWIKTYRKSYHLPKGFNVKFFPFTYNEKLQNWSGRIRIKKGSQEYSYAHIVGKKEAQRDSDPILANRMSQHFVKTAFRNIVEMLREEKAGNR